jgi:hypothetical protein
MHSATRQNLTMSLYYFTGLSSNMASTASRLSAQDRKDLEKFTKYLVYKCVQVIVQSRLGEKMQSISSPFSSSSDWVIAWL